MSAKLTTKEFIKKAREVHGDKYDYSKVEYNNCDTKVCIICPEHGEFWQTPSSHLSRKGCPKCSGRNKTTEDFIKKAREVHGDKYDYSKVEYVNATTKVCIICPEHGEFWQEAFSHLSGCGCPICSGNIKSSTEEFIKKAREAHGDKYNYSKVEYTNASTKVCIICPEHGEFWQTPNGHLGGAGCPKCANEKNGEKRRQTLENFITCARKIHGNKYNYAKVNYKNRDTKVCIICPEHGEFWQRPAGHLSGAGCPKCGILQRTKISSLTTEEFIEKAQKVHGGKYDYSKVEYIKHNQKVCIICPEHGEFWQTPNSHLNKHACPSCCGNTKLTTKEFIARAKAIHGDKYDYSKVKYINNSTKVCIICPEHGEFKQTPANHTHSTHPQGCPICNRGFSKPYKFNLLEEFEDEYEFRAFLDNNDTNILYAILQNIEPKYEPLKKDLQKALINIDDTNPMKSLKDKYTSDDDEEKVEDVVSEDETKETTENINDIDFDDEEALNNLINKLNEKSEGKDENGNSTNLSIEDVISNREKELKVIARIEHTLSPEVREYIKRKFLNDKMRMWMASRETQKK